VSSKFAQGLADAALWSHCLEHLQGIRQSMAKRSAKRSAMFSISWFNMVQFSLSPGCILWHIVAHRSTGLQCNMVHVNAVAAAKVDRSWPVMMKLLEITKTWRGLELDTIRTSVKNLGGL